MCQLDFRLIGRVRTMKVPFYTIRLKVRDMQTVVIDFYPTREEAQNEIDTVFKSDKYFITCELIDVEVKPTGK